MSHLLSQPDVAHWSALLDELGVAREAHFKFGRDDDPLTVHVDDFSHAVRLSVKSSADLGFSLVLPVQIDSLVGHQLNAWLKMLEIHRCLDKVPMRTRLDVDNKYAVIVTQTPLTNPGHIQHVKRYLIGFLELADDLMRHFSRHGALQRGVR